MEASAIAAQGTCMELEGLTGRKGRNGLGWAGLGWARLGGKEVELYILK